MTMGIRSGVIPFAALMLAVSGCGWPVVESEDEDLQELVLRWAFEAADTNLEPPAAHCLVVSAHLLSEGEDPDPEFLDRFRGDSIPVRPLSACRFEGDTRNHVVDHATGQHALLFSVGPVDWDERARPTVEVGYLQGSLWGRGWECSLVSDDGDWTVETCRRVMDI
jgi:hypothetical protein